MMATAEFDSAASQWQETVRTLIQSFNRIVGKYLTYEPKIESITEHICQKSFYLFRITNKTIFTEVSLTLKVLLTSTMLDARRRQTLLEEMETWLKNNKNQGQAVHDMMHILLAILDDVGFVTVKPHFQLLMRLYVEIVYFSAFCDEYSTYFYNLEILTRNFLKNLFGFLAGGTPQAETVFGLFAHALPELFVTKIINKKANETGVLFLGAFFDDLSANLAGIGPAHARTLLEKLFLVVSLRSLPGYIKITESDKDCMYVVFYDRLKQLCDKIRTAGNPEFVLMLLDVFSAKALLIHELFQLRGVKYRERIIDKEVQIGTGLLYHVLDHIEVFRWLPQFNLAKYLEFLQGFKSSYLKVEGLFGLKLEGHVDGDECFLPLVYNKLGAAMKNSADLGLQVQVLQFVKGEFGTSSDLLKNTQLIDRK